LPKRAIIAIIALEIEKQRKEFNMSKMNELDQLLEELNNETAKKVLKKGLADCKIGSMADFALGCLLFCEDEVDKKTLKSLVIILTF
jgi:hypothetical protein